MKLSARNQLKGVVSEVRKGAVTTIVKIEVRNPAVISASITNGPRMILPSGLAIRRSRSSRHRR
jgi:molybdopterin-binding protein